MSEKEESNIDINNSHLEFNIDPHSKYDEFTENHHCELIDEIYPPSQNEELIKNNSNEDNKSEIEDNKRSTSLDSKLDEDKNPNPIKINIKDSIEDNKDISKNFVEDNIFLSENEDNAFQNYLAKIPEIKESNFESVSQSDNSINEVTYMIKFKNEINYDSKPNLVGKKTKRKWKLKKIRKSSKKNKTDFIRTCSELVSNKKNNNEEDLDKDGDRLDIRGINFSYIYCNKKYYRNGYSPHEIEFSESLARYHASFGNSWQTISTKCNSYEGSGN